MTHRPTTAALALLISLAATVGCGAGRAGAGPGSDGGAPDVSQQAQLCPACVSTADCNGDVCAQFQGDTFCAPACGSAGECPADRTCRITTAADGTQVSICEPTNQVCGQDVGPPAQDDGGTATETCGTLVGPDVQASCRSCRSGPTCQANGCYGGWWCDTATNQCHAEPASCGGATGDAGLPPLQQDGGPPPTGAVGPTGGTLSRLLFAVVGDTRPPSVEDTTGYPTTIITTIYQHIAAASPMPVFVLATGDYMFTSGAQADAQLDLYLGARGNYPGTVFPAFGNHECTGATASNCGPGATDGVTRNYSSFMSKLLGPIGQAQPYYAFDVDAADASWTAKFVFIAANAWSSEQAAWLAQTMAAPTTYTFVVRHEPSSATTAPGVQPSDQVLAANPYTLLIVGHTHTYGRSGTRQIIIGNGGAPLTGSGDYGWGLFEQRADGAIQVDMIDYQTGRPDTGFRFAVKPDGTPAP